MNSSQAPRLNLQLPQSPLLSGPQYDEDLLNLLTKRITAPLPNLSFAPAKSHSQAGPSPSALRGPTSPRTGASLRTPRAPQISRKRSVLGASNANADKNKALPATPLTKLKSKQIIALLDFLDRMDADLTAEVQRVEENIEDARAQAAEYRREREARLLAFRKRRERERRETKEIGGDFWAAV